MCQGFTLVEAVIASGLFCMLLVLLVSSTSFFNRAFFRTDSRQGQIQSAEIIMLKLAADIRDSRHVETPTTGTRGNSLVLTDFGGNDIVYSLSPHGVVTRQEESSKAEREFGEGVTDLYFFRREGNILGIELTIGGWKVEPYRVITGFSIPRPEKGGPDGK